MMDTKMLYCELVTNVVYDNFQDILFPPWELDSALGNTRNFLRASPYILNSMGAIQCSREYKEFLKSISIHFNCSKFVLFML